MSNFPQICVEDVKEFDAQINEFISATDSSLVLIVEKSGYLIHERGETGKFDSQIISTLASNAYNASAYLANLLNETRITGMSQQGEIFSTMMLEIDEDLILVIIYKSTISSGAIKYYASIIIPKIANQIKIARERSPTLKFDLADLNAVDATVVFKKVPHPDTEKTSEVHQQLFKADEKDSNSTDVKNNL
ncbi:MAG TPA: hypothetical protein PLW02_09160 [Verrucomicrobiota bacterium]|nr:hypothetical protein [Verrucomicrobiota bacterium]